MQLGRGSACGGQFRVGLAWTFLPTTMQKGPPCRKAGTDLAGNEGELLCGIHRDQLAFSPSFEGHHTISFGKEGIVTAPPDVPARVEFGAPLPDDDSPGSDLLAAVPLYAKTFRVAVSTVSARTYAFFMCHRCPQICRPT